MEFELVGYWEKIEDVPVEHLYERMRNHRNRLLAESDWTQLEDAPVDKQKWAEYRQLLRNAPNDWTPSPVWVAPILPNN